MAVEVTGLRGVEEDLTLLVFGSMVEHWCRDSNGDGRLCREHDVGKANIYLEDILLVGGDVVETYDKFCQTTQFIAISCVRLDSLDKLNALLAACGELGVESAPMMIRDLGIIPLFSWYHEVRKCDPYKSLGSRVDLGEINLSPAKPELTKLKARLLSLTRVSASLAHPRLNARLGSSKACLRLKPKPGYCKALSLLPSAQLCDREDSLAQYFDAMNDKQADIIEEIQIKCINLFTFSDFVPRLARSMSREKDALYPNLPKMIGFDFLESRIRSRHGAKGSERACHVFGHTHFGWDANVDGIRGPNHSWEHLSGGGKMGKKSVDPPHFVDRRWVKHP
ncbi:hypothetical protein Cgig2_017694 [Carnegiea gigantea]|uniref:Uncharacterized protein n=1 Tax=Carnegiea gigantea TaxID=171969 RepID=A0A9Q1GMY9_9CARY|nr:hypothetical protein Cgig2_017694 [Carnegiea gigantea]